MEPAEGNSVPRIDGSDGLRAGLGYVFRPAVLGTKRDEFTLATRGAVSSLIIAPSVTSSIRYILRQRVSAY